MRLSPRCFAVTGLAYIPPWSVNAGFVAGEHTTLVVDTGANALAALVALATSVLYLGLYTPLKTRTSGAVPGPVPVMISACPSPSTSAAPTRTPPVKERS